uniref:DUF4283 domain-containing protein n=1 Tax=Cannabis sativa TaxID=3483 RepID=A0A803P9H3_CANSA
MAKTRSKNHGKSKFATKNSKKRAGNGVPDVDCSVSIGRITEMESLENSFKDTEQANRKVKITLDDIEEEVLFWNPSIVCYVLGVNPPLYVLEGFTKKIWHDKVINGGYIFFNRRPVILKPWDPNVNYKKEDVKCVPIWVHLEDLELKYWGQKSLFKIVGQLGKPLMEDSITKERERLSYARVLVEVQMDQQLPSILEFENEYASNTSVGIKYEWKLISCSHCSGIGHSADEFSNGQKGDRREKQQMNPAVTMRNTFQALSLEEQDEPTGGANNQTKQQLIKNFINAQKVNFVGFLETRVKAPKLRALYSNVFDGWCFSSNIAWHSGGKITMAWNPYRFTIDIIKCTSQLMHLRISTTEGFNSLLTMVYASNTQGERKVLWKDLCDLYSDGNWCVMGDFNDILAKEERVGRRVRSYPDSNFLNCVNFCKLEDVKASGNFFTWTNKQPVADRIYSKIDRIIANQAWINKYEFVEAVFLNEGLFDHSPAILSWHPHMVGGKNRSNILGCGNPILSRLREINKEAYCDLQQQVHVAKADLERLQNQLQQQPFEANLHQQEKTAREILAQKQQDYTLFLKQKAKMDWIQDGDSNSALFHACINHRLRQNRILSIENQEGSRVTEPALITVAFLDFYKSVLGTCRDQRKKVERNILNNCPLVTTTQPDW